jgi:hypothetical protein
MMLGASNSNLISKAMAFEEDGYYEIDEYERNAMNMANDYGNEYESSSYTNDNDYGN